MSEDEITKFILRVFPYGAVVNIDMQRRLREFINMQLYSRDAGSDTTREDYYHDKGSGHAAE